MLGALADPVANIGRIERHAGIFGGQHVGQHQTQRRHEVAQGIDQRAVEIDDGRVVAAGIQAKRCCHQTIGVLK